ncbi:MAG: hypothetical protein IJU37_08515 [Desulfovibrio sp.]|nr:hypothetical protein [Desulfovibrio sp.]
MQAAEESPFIARALETLRKISGNEKDRIEADARERALHDMADYYNEGVTNERRRMAIAMLSNGMPAHQVQLYTGYTLDQLNALRAAQPTASL